jgi:hypothetical protein
MKVLVDPLLGLMPCFSCHNLQGAESDELAAASKLEDGVNFYQTVIPNVAKLFHIDPNVKRPALVLLKKEEEKLNYFGLFSCSTLFSLKNNERTRTSLRF